MGHREYTGCLNLSGAELAWERRHTATGQRTIGYVIDMCQFHALNHQIGRAATNARVTDWLHRLRHRDIIAGGGDEFCVVIDMEDEAGFRPRLDATLHAAGLYAYIHRIELSARRGLFPQMEAAIGVIDAAKERALPPRWMFWRLNARVRRYEMGPNVFVEGGKA
jgi:predicted signal transduction protein with EAL and GGDEF domain